MKRTLTPSESAALQYLAEELDYGEISKLDDALYFQWGSEYDPSYKLSVQENEDGTVTAELRNLSERYSQYPDSLDDAVELVKRERAIIARPYRSLCAMEDYD